MMKYHEMILRQRDRGVGSSVQIAELDFEDPGRKCLDEWSHLSSAKSFSRLIVDKCNDIQYFHIQSPRKTVAAYQPRKFSLVRTIQAERTNARRPICSNGNLSYRRWAEFVRFALDRIEITRCRQQLSS